MENNHLIFNRVLGLKFLYDNFPYYFKKDRIEMFFVSSKKELQSLDISNKNYDTFLLKRSGNNFSYFLSDYKCKDNRFFNTLEELKEGASEFEDGFIFCVECHKFKKGEDYYSDKLVIAQFSTHPLCNISDKASFIPSLSPDVSTRDNAPYLILEYPFNSSNIFHVKRMNEANIKASNLGDGDFAYLAKELHRMIDNIREYLIELKCFKDFQLIVRIDSYLNLLPIDFRTPDAWANLKS